MGLEQRLTTLERHEARTNAQSCRCRVEIIETDISLPAGWESLRRSRHPLVDDDQLPPPTRCSACGRERLVVTIAEDDSGRPWSSRAARPVGGADGYVRSEKA